MTILSTKTNPSGPATLNIQLEQGADFSMYIKLKKVLNGVQTPWDLTGVVITAYMKPQVPVDPQVNFIITPIGPLIDGVITISLPLATALAARWGRRRTDSRTTVDQTKVKIGPWALYHLEQGITQRLLEGDAYIDLDPNYV